MLIFMMFCAVKIYSNLKKFGRKLFMLQKCLLKSHANLASKSYSEPDIKMEFWVVCGK